MSKWNLVSLQGSRNVLSTFPCVTRSLSEETPQMFWPHYRLLRLFEGFSVAQTAIRDLSKISEWKEALLWSFEVKLLIPGPLQTSLFSLHITSCFSSVSPFFFLWLLNMSFAFPHHFSLHWKVAISRSSSDSLTNDCVKQCCWVARSHCSSSPRRPTCTLFLCLQLTFTLTSGTLLFLFWQ